MLHPTEVSRIERGIMVPYPSQLAKLAAALELDIDATKALLSPADEA